MNFNPFRSTTLSSVPLVQAHQTTNTSEDRRSTSDDSWHTNNVQLGPQTVQVTTSSSSATVAAPSSAPLSWFSSWTSSTTIQSATATAQKSSLTSFTNDVKLQRSPSTLNMIRGVDSHESGDMGESFSMRFKHAIIGNPTEGGCIPTTSATTQDMGHDDLFSIIADVPFFPPPHEGSDSQQHPHLHHEQQLQRSSFQEEKSVVEFTSRPQANPIVPSSIDTAINPHTLSMQTKSVVEQPAAGYNEQQSHKVHDSLEDQTPPFPGFALYTMAQIYYALGQYTKALDTTTECLAFQKKALSVTNNTTTASSEASIHPTNSPSPSGFTDTMRHILSNGAMMTKESTSKPSVLVPNTSKSKLLSHYPAHECVAQTLLLRARVLAVCGLHGCPDNDEGSMPSHGDVTLVHQAIQHLEMAIAIQRKITTFTNEKIDVTQWDLAIPMILLGVLYVGIHRFEEADNMYEDALLTLRSMRQFHDEERSAAEKRGDYEMSQKHSKILQQITKEIAKVFYLKGKSFQCKRLYSDAFACYNKGLYFFRKSNASKYCPGSRRIIRYMKKSSALERLLSDYWDDPKRI